GIIPAAKALMDEIMNPSMDSGDAEETALSNEVKLANNAKKVALMVLGAAAQKYTTTLAEQQELLLSVADIIIDTYSMESAILRAQKQIGAKSETEAARYVDMVQVFCNDAIQRVETKAKNTIAAMSEGDEQRVMLSALKRFTKNNTPVNTVAARQRIAETLITANKYVF
ncbi:MAG: acyl-CoA dehydrogenase, partial [Pyrinomonadaceae bacterium]|nr:acyl-CoA dehydrogenase [Pyrinomonadaceae bacterium]